MIALLQQMQSFNF